MGQVKIVDETKIPWTLGTHPIAKDGVLRNSHTRFIASHNPGPRMGRVVYDPFYRSEAHWHAANEIIYILRGEITVGETTHGTGTAITIEAKTPYGPLVAGPEGAEFILIFDGDAKGSYKPGSEERS